MIKNACVCVCVCGPQKSRKIKWYNGRGKGAQRARYSATQQNPQSKGVTMYQYHAQLLRLIDADTYLVDIDLGFHVHTHHRIRIAGVDCPERGTLAGMKATQKAAAWWERHQRRATIAVIRYDRYGRTVAHIHGHDGQSLADALLTTGCHQYTGRK